MRTTTHGSSHLHRRPVTFRNVAFKCSPDPPKPTFSSRQFQRWPRSVTLFPLRVIDFPPPKSSTRSTAAAHHGPPVSVRGDCEKKKDGGVSSGREGSRARLSEIVGRTRVFHPQPPVQRCWLPRAAYRVLRRVHVARKRDVLYNL